MGILTFDVGHNVSQLSKVDTHGLFMNLFQNMASYIESRKRFGGLMTLRHKNSLNLKADADRYVLLKGVTELGLRPCALAVFPH